jgi:hypothetical protein
LREKTCTWGDRERESREERSRREKRGVKRGVKTKSEEKRRGG